MSPISFFNYDTETGVLTWSQTRNGRGCIEGRVAGAITHGGRYRTVVVLGKRYYCHRLAWEIVNGPIPSGLCIDHIDGNGLNNRIANLRVVTLSDNQRNRRMVKTNKTGIQGVHPFKGGFTVICAGRHITYTKDFFEACCARKSAELAHGYHSNHGRKFNANA